MAKFNTYTGLNFVGTFYSCLFFEIHDLGWRLIWSRLENFRNEYSSNSLSNSYNSLVIKKVFLISCLNPFYFNCSLQRNRKIRKVLPFCLSVCYQDLTAVDFLMLTLLCLHSVFFLFVTSDNRKHECLLLLLFVCFKWRQFR